MASINTLRRIGIGRMALRQDLVDRLARAFLENGYEKISMIELAKAADLSRRALYNHFRNKEEAFRFFLDQRNQAAVAAGIAAGRAVMAAQGSAVDVFTAVVNVRYGENRRRLMQSPHATEINDQAFKRCRDLMIGSAVEFQAQLAELVVELVEDGRIRLKPGSTPADVAQRLADGARGTNQSLPPVGFDELEGRYRAMMAALLYGVTDAK